MRESEKMVEFNFNSDEHPQEEFGLLAPGEYTAVVSATDRRENNAGTGEYISVEFVIVEGPAEGRRLWENLNIQHPNEVAVRISKATLAAICRACGKTAIHDTIELHDIPMKITIGKKTQKDTGEVVNHIKAFRRINGETKTKAKTVDNTETPW